MQKVLMLLEASDQFKGQKVLSQHDMDALVIVGAPGHGRCSNFFPFYFHALLTF
jgi:hypothetical protein